LRVGHRVLLRHGEPWKGVAKCQLGSLSIEDGRSDQKIGSWPSSINIVKSAVVVNPIGRHDAEPTDDSQDQSVLCRQRALQYRFVVSDSVAQEPDFIEGFVGVLTKKRCGCIDEERPQVRPPQIIFVFAAEQSDPKSETQLRDHTRRFDRFLLETKSIFCVINLPLLCKLNADFRIVVPMRSECGCQAFVNFVAQRYFEALQRSIQGFAERSVPHIQSESLCRVTAGDRHIALQSHRRHAACEDR
jgi:hypothetical protein